MLQQPSLDVPKGGRSRFSKALPAVPGLDVDTSPSLTSTLSKPAPGLPPSLPPLPSLPADDFSSSLNSPLPSVPPSQSQPQPTSRLRSPSGPPAMSIPRRPVGKPQVAPPPDPPTLSSSDSLDSLLSAYSRSSGESLMMLSEDKPKERGSDTTMSLDYTPQPSAATAPDVLPAPSVSRVPTASSQSGELRNLPSVPRRKPVGDSKSPPPPPAKEFPIRSGMSPERPVPKSEIGIPSSPQPQIWRRRSLKDSPNLSNLKIEDSPGSTAATQPAPKPTEQVAKPLPPIEAEKSLPPPPRGAGLVGRNIRPGATGDQLSRNGSMGHDASKVEGAKDATSTGSRPEQQSNSMPSEPALRPTMNRPPTPEYRNDDVKAPVIERYISPVSPASSPEPPKEFAPAAAKDALRTLSREPLSREAKPQARKQDLQSSKSVPDLQSRGSTPVHEPLPRPPLGYGMAAPERPASRGGDARFSGESPKGAPRSSSARPDQRRAMEQVRAIAPESDPRLVYSDTQGYMYKGRDGTLYPEMKASSQEPDARALYFPKQPCEPLAQGSVIKATSLKESHFGCFQRHKFMNRRANWSHPLTCQTCDKADAEDRWVCSFCHVRMCESCLGTFNSNQRDLRRLQDVLGRDATATATQPSHNRSGSGLGLEINF